MSEKMEYVRPSSISPSVTLTLLVVWSVIKVLDSSSGGSNGVSNDTYVVGIGISGEAIVNLFFFKKFAIDRALNCSGWETVTRSHKEIHILNRSVWG